MQCEHCDGLGSDECLIQEVFQYLLYDNSKHDYGCKLHYKTYKWLYDYDCETSARSYGLITGYSEEQGIISREPTKSELVYWKKQDKQYAKIMKRLKERERNAQ